MKGKIVGYVLISVALGFMLNKINRAHFFQHYFKQIEEIVLRNSLNKQSETVKFQGAVVTFKLIKQKVAIIVRLNLPKKLYKKRTILPREASLTLPLTFLKKGLRYGRAP